MSYGRTEIRISSVEMGEENEWNIFSTLKYDILFIITQIKYEIKGTIERRNFYINVTVATVIFLLVTSRGEVSFLSANL